MTTQAEDHRHSPQLIPGRLLRSGQLHHPAVLEEARRRSEKFQLRVADRITAFAGSRTSSGSTLRCSACGWSSWNRAHGPR